MALGPWVPCFNQNCFFWQFSPEEKLTWLNFILTLEIATCEIPLLSTISSTHKKALFHSWGPVRVKFRQATWPWNSDIRQVKWRQTTWRWVKTATATTWVETVSDEENHKYNGKMSTATWPPLQYVKGPPKDTYSPLREPHSCPPLLYQLHQLILQPCYTRLSVPNFLIRKLFTEHHTWQWELSTSLSSQAAIILRMST